ncbi:MAG: ATP-binding protein [Pedobacter sp.]|jgi:signal transduction histidine kinase|uniref:sensor histidine kinase n=1 Tax=Pedobacter sp. TaxID=1411316 RepID=UPI0035619607
MQFTPTEVIVIIILATFIFLLAPLFLLIYIGAYNGRKKKDLEEKRNMQLEFEAELLKTQIEVQEQTMQTIASDLHDNIGQLLSLTALTLSSINLKEPQKIEKKVAESIGLVNSSIKELRGLAKLMNGELIVQTGLGKAIKQEIDRLKKIGSYKIKVKNELLDNEISSPNKDLIVLRLLQEIINNIIKHAQASHIEIEVYIHNDLLYLTVKDNGIGFNYETAKTQNKGIGLSSIHNRIKMIEGKITINSNPNYGTLTTIEIPYP